jgi:hypothetical protein
MDNGLWIFLGMMVLVQLGAIFFALVLTAYWVRCIKRAYTAMYAQIKQFKQDIEKAAPNTNVDNARRELLLVQELYIEASYFYKKEKWRSLQRRLENIDWLLENGRVQLSFAEYKANRQSS